MREDNLRILTPSEIGEYINSGQCSRYALLNHDSTEEKTSRQWNEAFRNLSPVLKQSGDEFEDEIYAEVLSEIDIVVDSWFEYDDQAQNETQICETIQTVSSSGKIAALTQAKLAGSVGSFLLRGDSDIIIIYKSENTVHIHIFDIKASHEQKTYHQIQTACYSILVEELLEQTQFDTDIDIEIHTGIITRETELVINTPASYPTFDRVSREADVKRLLESSGSMSTTLEKSLDDASYQLDMHCRGCPFSETCYTRSIEQTDIRLLGLSVSEQSVFRSAGLHTLSDVAQLIEFPQSTSKYAKEPLEINPEHYDTVVEIKESTYLTESIPQLAQRAQVLLCGLDDGAEYAFPDSFVPGLHASGAGTLPTDSPPDYVDLEYPRESLIRVYLNVQHDYVVDSSYMISGSITATKYTGDPISFSHLYHEHNHGDDAEKVLIENVVNSINQISTKIAVDMDVSETAVHCYFYSSEERTQLIEACDRYSEVGENTAIHNFATFLTESVATSEQTTTVLLEEIDNHYASKYLSDKITILKNVFFPATTSNERVESWEITHEGSTIDLSTVFYDGLFDAYDSYISTQAGFAFKSETGETGETTHSDWYPILPRWGSDIPLEYLYASEEFAILNPEDTDIPQYKGAITRYQFDRSGNRRINCELLKRLGELLSRATQHIERGLHQKNKDIIKHSRSVKSGVIDTETEDSTWASDSVNLKQGLREYLRIEHQQEIEEFHSHVQKTPLDRILTGKALPVEITEVDDSGYNADITGTVCVDKFPVSNPDEIMRSSKLSDGNGSSSPDYVTLFQLYESQTGYHTDPLSPKESEQAPRGPINSLDLSSGEVSLTIFSYSPQDTTFYTNYHRKVTSKSSSGKWTVTVQPGDIVLIDSSIDSIVSDQYDRNLQNIDSAEAYQTISSLHCGKSTAVTDTGFSCDGVDSYLDMIQSAVEFMPNKNQTKFIREVNNQFVLLQGPPGTGKTAGSIAHTICSRIYDKQSSQDQLVGLVSGASNKSIDEVLEDVVSLRQQWIDQDLGPELTNTKLIRLTKNAPSEQLPGVTYLHYRDEEKVERLQDQLTASAGETLTPTNVVIFSTPFTLTKTIYSFPKLSNIVKSTPNITAFDFIVVDEASMMPCPQFFTLIKFFSPPGQVFISGDHRQMAPVQKQDWTENNRQSIKETGVYLSVLNYFRALRGDEMIDIDQTELSIHGSTEVPLIRLNETYRCHASVANFLQKWVYTRDNIRYHSRRTETLPDIDILNRTTSGIEYTQPISLITHTDTSSQQSNIIEAEIVNSIITALPSETDVGVIAPHNAQKGLLSSSVPDNVHVDTVERFQGGEKDVLILSTTVSDPTYISAESDFLLNLNRLNVAVSRMKQKLIIIAPETIFKIIPTDILTYTHSMIWKGLYSDAVKQDQTPWNGSLTQFNQEIPRQDTNLSIYNWGQ
jgi:uncharacterized protein